MKKIILTAMALTVSSLAGEVSQLERSNTLDYVFVSGGGALLNVDASLSPTNTLIDSALDDNGGIFEIGAGYNVDSNIFTEIAYQRSMLASADIDNFNVSLNSRFYNFGDVDAYVGGILGYSTLSWTEDPHTVKYSKDLTSSSLTVGVQLGTSMKVSDNVSITAKYQYLYYGHLLDVTNATSTVEHNGAHHFLLGVSYDL